VSFVFLFMHLFYFIAPRSCFSNTYDRWFSDNTNNVAELTSLVRGLQTTVHHQYHRLVIEGDSQVIIQLISKILHGKPPWWISPNWRLSGLLEDFGDIINPNLTLIPSHVKREANKIADHLENAGIDANAELIYWQAHDSKETDLSRHCKDLACRDFPTPDGVTCSSGATGGLALDPGINSVNRHPRACINHGGRP